MWTRAADKAAVGAGATPPPHLCPPHKQNPLSSFYSGGISASSGCAADAAMDKCLLHEGHKRIRDFSTFKHENVLALCENKIKGNTRLVCAPARGIFNVARAPPAAGAFFNFSRTRLMQYFISPLNTDRDGVRLNSAAFFSLLVSRVFYTF